MKTTHTPPVPEMWTVEVDAREHRGLFATEVIFQRGLPVADQWFFTPEVRSWLDAHAPGLDSWWDYGEMGGDPVVHLRFTDKTTASEFVNRFAQVPTVS